ncbi:hypothetical protein [Actibacterium sp. 188UL27-1]|uniref:DUF7742 family protein n=1 Tax=Actibacterium sp. 188UL27-1 TaxID=2786961 RepID=UPI00195C07E6|nr:hypothetical protein [Actibacterium sp. 188UL27-1]MBM7068026.1 hypothetical protein [Actibacterium sp. 188UL27-1]
MRPVVFTDVAFAARALLALPADLREERAARLVRQAAVADRYRRRFGKAHPAWGNGSLMGAAARLPRSPIESFGDPGFCACFAMVLQALVAHGYPATQRAPTGSGSCCLGGPSQPQFVSKPEVPSARPAKVA